MIPRYHDAHRTTLWIEVCRLTADGARLSAALDPLEFGFVQPTDGTSYDRVWRSRLSANGAGYPDWFLLGIGVAPSKLCAYYVPNTLWDRCGFAAEFPRAPLGCDSLTSDALMARIQAKWAIGK